MKSVAAVCLLLCSLNSAFCQSEPGEPTVEELRQEILSLKQETQAIQLHLSRSHREFKTGTIFYALGIGLTIAGASAEAGNRNGGNLILIGTGFTLIGGILHIDSHKYIGRAGVSRVNPKRLGIKRN